MGNLTASVRSDPEVRAALRLVRAQLETTVHERRLPGLSAAFVYGDEVLWAGGFGRADRATGRPADGRSVYRIASISKLFTATALMQLRDAGTISLDDPITTYVPELRIRQVENAPIRLRHLVAHASGIQREPYTDHWLKHDTPRIEVMIEELNKGEVLFPPYTEIHYSNVGVGLVGLAIERAAGQPFTEYVVERILKPLGMARSGYRLTEEMKAHQAIGYYEPEGDAVPEWNLGGLTAGGGLYSTVEDLARFIRFQFVGNEAVLADVTRREMWQPVILQPDGSGGFGIGWALGDLNGKRTIGHGGAVYGYRTALLLVPEQQVGGAIFVNTAYEPNRLLRDALAVLLPPIERFTARQRSEPERPEPPEEWSRYVGVYAWRGFAEMRVSLHRRALVLHRDPSPAHAEATLEPIEEEPDRFRARGGSANGELVRFELDEAGRPVRLWIGAYPYDRVDETDTTSKES